MTCIKCQHGTAKRFGRHGKSRIQRYRCNTCKATFSDPHENPLGSHTIDLFRAVHVVTLLCEGMSVRAVSRATGVHKRTILSLLLMAGEKSRRLFDSRVHGVRPRFVQADELWTFVHTKQAHLDRDDPQEWGDQYVWMAIDSETKMVLSYYTGKRTAESAAEFVRDLSERITGRFQLTTDGLNWYLPAVEERFGAAIDYAQLLKLYGKADSEGPDLYSPTTVKAVVPVPVSGEPKLHKICTSHVERANLSVRTHLRRFTRLSLGFSKSLEHLKAAVHLYMAFFNFCRVHQTIRVTPAMEAKLSDHIWSVEELLTWTGR